MTRKEDMAALRADTQVHYNCAQAVVVPFARDMGVTRGALVGALTALGGLGQPQEKRLELIQQFRDENGAIDCAALLKAAFERGEEKKPHCDRMVRQCVDFVCRETGLE